jgi:hypothetical protein
MWGIYLTDNNYELKISLSSANSNVTVNLFVIKY